MLTTFGLLSLAVLAVWLPPFRLTSTLKMPCWVPVFLASLVAAWWDGIVTPVGVAATGAFGALTYGISIASNVWLRRALSVACAAFGIALSMHAVPGFANPLVVSPTTLGPDAVPFRLYFNYDKGIVGLMLLAWLCRPANTRVELHHVAVRGVSLGLVTGVAVMALAWALGYVKPDPKWPSFGLSFLWANLFLTCLAEEAFFRGWLQERWTQMTEGRPGLAWIPVALSAALFGLVHLPGGTMLALLATFSGLMTALVYARYRQVEVAILIHFFLNAMHFVGFTYPRLM